MSRVGTRTWYFEHPPFIVSRASIVGRKEGEGPLGHQFDVVLPDDLIGQKSWEWAEMEMLRRTIELCAQKANCALADVDALLAGDLNDQIIASGFCARSLGLPFIGLYGACSTMVESMAIGSALVASGYLTRAICAASSHFCTAERQFRFPLELGTQRPPSAQWTATAAGAVLLCSAGTADQARITHATLGCVRDKEITDANHMGAAMAPAVTDTIIAHLSDTGRDFHDFDVIATGDLGHIGRKILIELLRENGYEPAENTLIDCGASLYAPEQDTHAGGSGCGCIASVSCASLIPRVESGEWRRILLVGSGAMLSPTSSQQGESIPGISYAVALEGGK